MDSIIERQSARISDSDMQVEQLFEIENVLKEISEIISTGVIDLYSVMDDGIKSISKSLINSSQMNDLMLEATFENTETIRKLRSEADTDSVSLFSMLDDNMKGIISAIKDLTYITKSAIKPEVIRRRLAPVERAIVSKGYVQTREDFIESKRIEEKNSGLLQEIADNTKDLSPGSGSENKDNNGSSSFLGALIGAGFFKNILGNLEKSIMAIFSVKAITGVFSKNKLVQSLFGSKGIMGNFAKTIKGVFSIKALAPILFIGKTLLKIIFAPINLVLGIFKSLYDALTDYSENGDIISAVKTFFGSLVNWLSFGIIGTDFKLNDDSWLVGIVSDFIDFVMDNVIKPWGERFIDSTKSLGKFIRENLLEPIYSLFDTVVKLFTEYISEPITNGIKSVGKFVRENVVDPIINAFKGIRDFVIDLKNKLFGIFDKFEIPKNSFTIPVIDKEVSIGPWYPFRSDDKSKLNDTQNLEYNKIRNGTPEANFPEIVSASTANILPPQPTESEEIYRKSSEVSDMSKNIIIPNTNVVSVPTTNNVNNTTNLVKVQPRNNDSTLQKMSYNVFF